jgi:hypothetical protein
LCGALAVLVSLARELVAAREPGVIRAASKVEVQHWSARRRGGIGEDRRGSGFAAHAAASVLAGIGSKFCQLCGKFGERERRIGRRGERGAELDCALGPGRLSARSENCLVGGHVCLCEFEGA